MNNYQSGSYSHHTVLSQEHSQEKMKSGNSQQAVKTFTPADLWNIQRLGKSRTGRRFL